MNYVLIIVLLIMFIISLLYTQYTKEETNNIEEFQQYNLNSNNFYYFSDKKKEKKHGDYCNISNNKYEYDIFTLDNKEFIDNIEYKEQLNNPDYYLNMGLTAEKLAKKYDIKREDSDYFSFNSHMKATKAIEENLFNNEILPYNVEQVYLEKGKRKVKKWTVSKDEGPRKDTSMEVLSKLRPAFKVGGQVTAGNSSQMSDGAAFVVVMSEDMIKRLNVKPIARMVSYATAGVEPSIMGIGPAEAVPKALNIAGLNINQIDQVELNEAFAAQALSVIKALDLNKEIVNVNGGAVALGHPLGMTGAKLSIQLINEMKRRKQKYGIVTACVGGGQGVCGVYENLT